MKAAILILVCILVWPVAWPEALSPATTAPEPQFIPVPQFVPIPIFAALPLGGETEAAPSVYPVAPRADGPAAPRARAEQSALPGEEGAGHSSIIPAPATQPPKILRWERRCGPNGCENVPIYEETPDQAALKLRELMRIPLTLNPQMRESELERLSEIVDRPALAKAIRQEWSQGTCAMMCVAGGSKLYDVFPDGTVKLAAEQPATAPDEGVHGGGRRRVRIFGRRR